MGIIELRSKAVSVSCAFFISLSAANAKENEEINKCYDSVYMYEQANCLKGFLKKQDIEIEKLHHKLYKKISLNGQKQHKKAYKAWIDYKKKYCEFETMGHIDGTIYPVVLLTCYYGKSHVYINNIKQQVFCEEGNLSCGGQ